METKTCWRCKELKSVSEYNKLKRSRDGLQASCRKCSNEATRVWALNNKEKLAEKAHAQYLADRKLLIEDLGGKCTCCGESTYEFLQVDHKNDNGYVYRDKHRKGLSIKQLGEHLEELQVLCGSCHQCKSAWGRCIHQKYREITTSLGTVVVTRLRGGEGE